MRLAQHAEFSTNVHAAIDGVWFVYWRDENLGVKLRRRSDEENLAQESQPGSTNSLR